MAVTVASWTPQYSRAAIPTLKCFPLARHNNRFSSACLYFSSSAEKVIGKYDMGLEKLDLEYVLNPENSSPTRPPPPTTPKAEPLPLPLPILSPSLSLTSTAPNCSPPANWSSLPNWPPPSLGLARKSVICELCDRELFPESGDLQTHVCAPNEKRRFQCHLCDRRPFFERCNLKKHISSIHMKVRPYKCHTCDKSFRGVDGLKRHMGTDAHGVLERLEKSLEPPS